MNGWIPTLLFGLGSALWIYGWNWLYKRGIFRG